MFSIDTENHSHLVESSETLDRTASQERAQAQVEDVLGRLGSHRHSVEQLKDIVCSLSTRIGEKGNCLEDEKRAFESCQKSARSYGEDLLDDTLALDKLTGLFPEDRVNRKAAISCLDALLEEIDKVKSDLASLGKDLNAKLTAHSEAMQSPSSLSTADGPSEKPLEVDILVGESLEGESQSELSNETSEVGSPSCLNRTESQARKQVQVQDVMSRLESQKDPIHRLKEKVSRLVARLERDGAQWEEERKVLEDCQKLARNIGEDLLEDIVVLDGLSGLLAEDRNKRKVAIAELDGHLGEVDKVKSDLAIVRKTLEEKLEECHGLKQAAECKDLRKEVLNLRGGELSAQQPSNPPEAQSKRVLHLRGGAGGKSAAQHASRPSNPLASAQHRCQECGKVSSEGRIGDSGFEGQWFCSECWRSWESSRTESPEESQIQSCVAPQATTPEVPVPEEKFWTQLELPLRLKVSEESGGYTVCSQPCNLQVDEVSLQLSRDASCLTISGTHQPTASDLRGMRDRIQKHLVQSGQKSLDWQAAQTLYARMGRGSFGKFSETLRLPRDVDVTHISASCVEGVLRVTLPKRVRRARPALGHMFPW